MTDLETRLRAELPELAASVTADGQGTPEGSRRTERWVALLVGLAVVMLAGGIVWARNDTTSGKGNGRLSVQATRGATDSAPAGVVKQAAARSLAMPSAKVRGTMAQHGRDLVALVGRVDFARHRTAVVASPTGNVAPYPPFEVRFVDGLNYIEIDSALRRPPALLANTQWIAYQGDLKVAPVPDRVIPPTLPIDALEWPQTKAIADARFVHSPERNTKKIVVRFRDAPYNTDTYTYKIDSHGRIAGFTSSDASGGSGSLAYVYGTDIGNIVAPSTGIQRVAPGSDLYATTTTAPTLGRSYGPNQHGFGQVRPSTIFLGGDPTGLVNHIHWQSWGGAHATGNGIGYYEPPGKIVADSVPAAATVVAFNLGTCHGKRAYQAIEWFYPQHGETFNAGTYINICTGDYVGTR